MRPPGYEPGELPTAPLRDVISMLSRGFPCFAGAKVLLFFLNTKFFCIFFHFCPFFSPKAWSFEIKAVLLHTSKLVCNVNIQN